MLFFRTKLSPLSAGSLLVGLLLHIPLEIDAKFCPPLGPVFDPPTGVAKHPEIIAASRNLSAALIKAIQEASFDGRTFDPTKVSFSINFGSVNDEPETPAFEYHHSASPEAFDSSSSVNITGDSIYRIGSVSKLMIPYALLIARGRPILNERVIDFIPELRKVAISRKEEGGALANANQVAWNEVTIGSLASHTSGIGQLFALTDFSAIVPDEGLSKYGFPALDTPQKISCNGNEIQPPCSREILIEKLAERHPDHHTFVAPAYNNGGFILLAYALQNLTGKPWPSAVEDLIFKPLNLTKTSYTRPSTNNTGVIPAIQKWWTTDLGDVSATGGIFASTNDLSNLARGILKSTLLPLAETRSWMKPTTHTSNPNYSLGGPWEIRRVSLNTTSGGRTIDLYTKDGSLVSYFSRVVLIPDFDVTLAINVAGEGARAVLNTLSDLVVTTYLPLLENTARQQALAKFGGFYKSSEANSSIRIEADEGPGLIITSWINNGVDLIAQTLPVAFQSALSGFPRIYPTGLESSLCSEGGKNSECSVNEISYGVIVPLVEDDLQIFTDNCGDWGYIDVLSYGNVGLQDLMFRLSAEGEVSQIELRGFRTMMDKQSGI